MGEGFQDCVVAFIDMVGIKSKAANCAGSALMRQMHASVGAVFQQPTAFPAISHAYVWNDSILTVSLLSEPPQFRPVLRDIAAIRTAIDAPTFAVVIKGQAFPDAEAVAHGTDRLTILRSSSWAMANCFKVEDAASATVKELKVQGKSLPCWYIDDRLVQAIGELRSKASTTLSVEMFPDHQERRIWCFTSEEFRIKVE